MGVTPALTRADRHVDVAMNMVNRLSSALMEVQQQLRAVQRDKLELEKEIVSAHVEVERYARKHTRPPT